MQRERADAILNILKEKGYVTVKYLIEQLHYSNATINRDLNRLAEQKLIKRYYGGVEILKKTSLSLDFRYHKMHAVKNLVAKKAAEFVCDGMTIFIDGSTTAQYMAEYLLEKSDITVITNNMNLVSFLSEHNVNAVCLGGKVVENPYMLYSSETTENIKSYNADMMFFSTSSFSEDGKILNGELYYTMHKAMAQNSKKVVFLADSGKLNVNVSRTVFDFSEIDYIITDCDFSSEVVERCKGTTFINVKTAL
jgi:DeoR/GlpR family transcriptional regulator of sugar metabolism